MISNQRKYCAAALLANLTDVRQAEQSNLFYCRGYAEGMVAGFFHADIFGARAYIALQELVRNAYTYRAKELRND